MRKSLLVLLLLCPLLLSELQPGEEDELNSFQQEEQIEETEDYLDYFYYENYDHDYQYAEEEEYESI